MLTYDKDTLEQIFNENKNKRICVIGTTCTGKSSIIKELNIGLDMDEEIFPLLSKEELDYVCTIPWTEEIGEKMDELVRNKLRITPGVPLFGTVLLDCDLIIYLHISDELLKERTYLRNVDFVNAKNMQLKIEQEINNSELEVIKLEIIDNRKKAR